MSDTNTPDPQHGHGDQQPPSYGQSPSYGQPPAYGQGEQPHGAPPAYGQGPTGQPHPGQAPYGAGGVMAPQQEQTWSSAAHWSALVAGVVTSGVFAFAGPLLIMLVKGNESPRVRHNAVESLNFQLSMLIYGIVSLVLWLVLVGILLSIVVGFAWLVLTIVGAVKTNNGEDYRYPLTIRMVS